MVTSTAHLMSLGQRSFDNATAGRLHSSRWSTRCKAAATFERQPHATNSEPESIKVYTYTTPSHFIFLFGFRPNVYQRESPKKAPHEAMSHDGSVWRGMAEGLAELHGSDELTCPICTQAPALCSNFRSELFSASSFFAIPSRIPPPLSEPPPHLHDENEGL